MSPSPSHRTLRLFRFHASSTPNKISPIFFFVHLVLREQLKWVGRSSTTALSSFAAAALEYILEDRVSTASATCRVTSEEKKMKFMIMPKILIINSALQMTMNSTIQFQNQCKYLIFHTQNFGLVLRHFAIFLLGCCCKRWRYEIDG